MNLTERESALVDARKRRARCFLDTRQEVDMLRKLDHAENRVSRVIDRILCDSDPTCECDDLCDWCGECRS